jgi:DNA-binding NarL/FixJ family response regulator
MNPGKVVRLVILDDQAYVRRVLGAAINAAGQLVGEADSVDELVDLCQMVQPEAALVHVRRPHVEGVVAVHAILRRWPEMRILVLTTSLAREHTLGVMDAGAWAVIGPEARPDAVAEALRQCCPDGDALPANTPDLPPARANEMAQAARIQASILPEKVPNLPGWEIAVWMQSARETSGDFYDFIPLANDKLGILVADVSDKGMGAALFMALANTLFRTYAVRYPTLPALALSMINERILSDTHGSSFVTSFFGVLEPHTGRLRYVNAGHNPPLLTSSMKSKPIDRLRRTGMALGILENSTWEQKMIRFSPGDSLLLYTDGVTEAQNRHGEFYGEERLMDITRLKRTAAAAELLSAVQTDLERFMDGDHPHDDIVLMALSRRS